jgi:hypothetical protein
METLNHYLSHIDTIKLKVGEDGWFIFQRHSEGYSYKKIASVMKIGDKAVDNSLLRIEKKWFKMFDCDGFYQ